jgi:hypothetical protein
MRTLCWAERVRLEIVEEVVAHPRALQSVRHQHNRQAAHEFRLRQVSAPSGYCRSFNALFRVLSRKFSFSIDRSIGCGILHCDQVCTVPERGERVQRTEAKRRPTLWCERLRKDEHRVPVDYELDRSTTTIHGCCRRARFYM